MKAIESRSWIGRVLAVAGLTLAASACAADRVGAPAVEMRPETSVVVENYNWADITVRVVRDGAGNSHRLGMVTSQDTKRFTIPPSILAASGRVRLIADPIGGGRPFVTDPINVRSGETIDWTLEASLNLSSWRVR